MRNIYFKNESYYELSNEGQMGQKVFIDDLDKVRLLFMILHFQSPTKVNNPNWYCNNFNRKLSFGIKKEKQEEMIKIRNLELLCFSIRDEGFYLLIKSLDDDVPSAYMHRILTGYSKYFNSKYKRKGHVFSGPFKARLLADKKKLIDASILIHQSNLSSKTSFIHEDKWSSFSDYIESNRWGDFLKTNYILSGFKTQTEYKNLVLTNK